MKIKVFRGMAMEPFGWKQWSSLYRAFKISKRHSIERYGLSYLHSDCALDGLAHVIAKILKENGKRCEVSIESIWVDGTPQAEAKMPSGCLIKCELADLLFILQETNQANSTISETGLLIQGKATPKYNKLTSGNSTKKERQLLEGMDRSQPITLYRGTSANKNSVIGTYILNGVSTGLGDCSRYLLMPKSAAWIPPPLLLHYYPAIYYYAPFQVGWPKDKTSPYLQSPQCITESFKQMALLKNIGKNIIYPSNCEWSRMVNDLRGNYLNTQMAGYGGQPRINNSSKIAYFSSSIHTSNYSTRKIPPNYPPNTNAEQSNTEENSPPSISIIKVTIRHVDSD